MANSSISLSIDLTLFAEGLKTALRMGETFSKNLNDVLSGRVKLDTKELDKALADFQTKVSQADTSIDIDSTRAVEGVQRITQETEKAAEKTKSKVLSIRDSLAMWGLAINSVERAFNIATRAMDALLTPQLEAEAAQAALGASLLQTGIYSESLVEKLTQQSEAFQDLTKYEDDLTLSNTALMQNIGQMSDTVLVKAQKAAIGISAAYRLDLATAMEAVGKAAAGNFATLGRYGIILDDTGTAAEKFAQLLQIGIDKFPLAEAEAKTGAGAIEQFKNVWGDMLETIGQIAIPVLGGFIKVLKPIVEWFANLTPLAKGLVVLMPLLTATWIKLSIAAGGAAISTGSFTAAISAASVAVESFLATIGPVGWVLMGVSVAVGVWAANSDKAKKSTDDLTDSTQEMTKEGKKQVENYDQLVGRLKALRSEESNSATAKRELKRVAQELNDNYGTWIGNINLEAGAWDKVASSLSTAREKLIQYQMSQALEATYRDQLTRVVKLRLELQNLTGEGLDLMEKVNRGIGAAPPDSLLGGPGDYYDIQADKIAKIRNELKEAEKDLAEYQRRANSAAASLGLQSTDESNMGGTGVDSASGTGAVANSYESLLSSIENYRNKVNQELAETGASPFSIAIMRAENDAQTLRDNLDKALSDQTITATQHSKMMEVVNSAAFEKQLSIAKTYYLAGNEQMNQYHDQRLNEMRDQHTKETSELNSKYTDAITSLDQYWEGMGLTEEQYQLQRKELTLKWNADQESLKDRHLKAMNDLDAVMRAEAINKEREGFEKSRAELDAYLEKLKTWKELGLNVSTEMAATWDKYHELLKSQMEKSKQALADAESGKTQVTAEELALRKLLYDGDLAAYLQALANRKEAELRSQTDIQTEWRRTHQLAVSLWSGMVDGLKSLWDTMTDKTMTGAEKWKKALSTVANSWYSTLGNMLAEQVRNMLYSLAVHQTTETAKTAATAVGETTRLALFKQSLLGQIALAVWGAVKKVAIYLFEVAAALTAWFAPVLGPFAPLATLAVMGGVVGLVNSFRKGFGGGGYTGEGNPNEEAGIVHKDEVVFESAITRKNLPQLMWLRGALQKGIKLADIIPGVSMQYAPVPKAAMAVSYAGGGYTGKGAESSELKNIMMEILSIMKTGTFTGKMDFDRRQMAIQVDQGNRERRVIR